MEENTYKTCHRREYEEKERETGVSSAEFTTEDTSPLLGRCQDEEKESKTRNETVPD